MLRPDAGDQQDGGRTVSSALASASAAVGPVPAAAAEENAHVAAAMKSLL